MDVIVGSLIQQGLYPKAGIQTHVSSGTSFKGNKTLENDPKHCYSNYFKFLDKYEQPF